MENLKFLLIAQSIIGMFLGLIVLFLYLMKGETRNEAIIYIVLCGTVIRLCVQNSIYMWEDFAILIVILCGIFSMIEKILLKLRY